jgi:hypothetical protein
MQQLIGFDVHVLLHTMPIPERIWCGAACGSLVTSLLNIMHPVVPWCSVLLHSAQPCFE